MAWGRERGRTVVKGSGDWVGKGRIEGGERGALLETTR